MILRAQKVLMLNDKVRLPSSIYHLHVSSISHLPAVCPSANHLSIIHHLIYLRVSNPPSSHHISTKQHHPSNHLSLISPLSLTYHQSITCLSKIYHLPICHLSPSIYPSNYLSIHPILYHLSVSLSLCLICLK